VYRRAKIGKSKTHPKIYAINSGIKDPASRLSIFLEDKDKDGSEFARWFSSDGEKVVQGMNIPWLICSMGWTYAGSSVAGRSLLIAGVR